MLCGLYTASTRGYCPCVREKSCWQSEGPKDHQHKQMHQGDHRYMQTSTRRTLWYVASRTAAKIPRPNIRKLAILGQERRVVSNIADITPESPKVGISVTVIQLIQERRALVVEALAIQQRIIGIRELGDPYRQPRIRCSNLTDMRREALKVPVPVDRNEVGLAAV